MAAHFGAGPPTRKDNPINKPKQSSLKSWTESGVGIVKK